MDNIVSASHLEFMARRITQALRKSQCQCNNYYDDTSITTPENMHTNNIKHKR